MRKRSNAGTFLRVSKIRERQRKIELAQAQAEHQKAQDQLEAEESKRTAQVESIRDQVCEAAISAASLSLMSDALYAGHQRIDEASQIVDESCEPLDDARDALTTSATKRRVAEKFVEKRKATERMRTERKRQREADEQAATRSVASE